MEEEWRTSYIRCELVGGGGVEDYIRCELIGGGGGVS